MRGEDDVVVEFPTWKLGPSLCIPKAKVLGDTRYVYVTSMSMLRPSVFLSERGHLDRFGSLDLRFALGSVSVALSLTCVSPSS